MKNRIIPKNIYIGLALFSTVLFAGCQKSDDAPNDLPSGKGKVAFNLHAPGAFLSKAVGVGDENGGINDKIAFYQFNKEGKYEQRYILDYAGATSVGENNNTRSYSLELTSSTGGEKRFIIE